jgi:hypothetical protein
MVGAWGGKEEMGLPKEDSPDHYLKTEC